ncbi:16S rRNA (guanine(966)-N(2))-methyltransferase RsmD [Alteromonas sp. 1_MG-2023]|uniref:16S rRNA (guanine(966)-N(2))-methyltransferase RsmD n=1 Tax=Alteromonas sp. 1_MG-2023 TaxID=3062669 RepID=UPI0026E3578F|nr:16S rRNA (guanine(966)-N(2))-methyltransferase RsmD [Alteromonas sp. 1_MG-2023]MDO6567998.1 16S rRNA (guanine(966)-N(2))-methyltransferase RsmD [Alteromonas sp. 1_MG-2023]
MIPLSATMKRVSRPSRASSPAKKSNSAHAKAKAGHIRIISGQWRGRKLPVLDTEGLRPTTDRNKETLFNWLMPYLNEARCLDVFAGSGGLGLEALSRYALSCDFVELDKSANAQLKKNLAMLTANNAQAANVEAANTKAANTKAANKKDHSVHQGDALAILPTLSGKNFDIIFVDPPFNKGLIEPTLSAIEANKLLSNDGVLYVEHEANLAPITLPNHWQIIKEKRTSALCYYLIKAA